MDPLSARVRRASQKRDRGLYFSAPVNTDDSDRPFVHTSDSFAIQFFVIGGGRCIFRAKSCSSASARARRPQAFSEGWARVSDTFEAVEGTDEIVRSARL